VATAKGRGTGPNNFAQRPGGARRGAFTYIATLLYGSLAAVDLNSVDLKAATEEVLTANRMKAAEEKIAFAGGANPIKHVIYVIKENRTYDQVFGDLGKGNGDPELNLFGDESAPNHRELARRFTLFDNFYADADVSADGNNWAFGAALSITLVSVVLLLLAAASSSFQAGPGLLRALAAADSPRDRWLACAVNRVCVISSSGAVVLMEQTTKTISALHRTGRQRDHACWFMGSALPEPLMRPGIVVVLDELDQHPLQVSPTEDQ